MKKIIYLIIILLFSSSGMPEENSLEGQDQLSAYISGEITKLSETLSEWDEESPVSYRYFFNYFSIQIGPSFSFGLNSIVSRPFLRLRVTPSISIGMARPFPKNWTFYYPGRKSK